MRKTDHRLRALDKINAPFICGKIRLSDFWQHVEYLQEQEAKAIASDSISYGAVTYDPLIGGGAVVRSYLDGVLTDTDSWTGPPMVFEVAKIGANRGENLWFAGRVDEVRSSTAHSRKRRSRQSTTPAVKASASHHLRRVLTPLLAWLVGGPATETLPILQEATTARRWGTPRLLWGWVDQAFGLDGSQDYVEVPDSPDLEFCPTCPLTVDLWAYRTGGGSVMHLIGKRGEFACSGSNTEGTYRMGGSILLRLPDTFFFGNPGGPQVDVFQNLPLNTWTHLTATFGCRISRQVRGNVKLLYQWSVGGSYLRATSVPSTIPRLGIGGSGACDTFPGLLDEVEIFNRALSPGRNPRDL